MKTRRFRCFEVGRPGHDPVIVAAQSSNRALVKAHREIRTLAGRIDFDRFAALAIVRPLRSAPKPDGYDHIRIYYALDIRPGSRVEVRAPHYMRPKKGTVVYPGISSGYVSVQLDGHDELLAFPPDDVKLLRKRP